MSFPIRAIVLFFLCIGLLSSACRKDYELFIPQPPNTHAPGQLLSGDVAGQVIDEGGMPVAHARILMPGGISTRSNPQGLFRLRRVSFTERYTPIAITHPQYHRYVGFIGTSPQGLAIVKPVLLGVEQQSTFHSSNSAMISLGQTHIELPPAAVATTDGVVFSGQVQWQVSQWDSGEPLRGWPLPLVQTPSGLSFVYPFGIWVWALQDTRGHALGLRSGIAAQARLQLNESHIGPLGQGTTLYHLDTLNGFWKPATTASLQGNQLEAVLPATGYWMAGQTVPATWISGKLQTAEMVPISQLQVQVVLEDGWVIGTFPLQSNGSFVAYIPANRRINLRFTDACGQTIHERGVGPFQGPTRLAPFTADNVPSKYLQGRLLTCQQGEATSAEVSFETAQQAHVWHSQPDGYFQGFGNNCLNTWVLVQAIDPASGLRSLPQVIHWEEELVLPPMSLCVQGQSWIFTSLNGATSAIKQWSLTANSFSWKLSGSTAQGIFFTLQASATSQPHIYSLAEHTAQIGEMGSVYLENGQLVLLEWTEQPEARKRGYWWATFQLNDKNYYYTGAFQLLQ